MDVIKKHPFFKIISILLVFSFINLNVSWSYPVESPDYRLSTQGVFQQEMMTEKAQEFQNSIFAEAKLLVSVCSIAKYLLEDSLPPEYLEPVIDSELGEALAGIEISGIMAENGVVSIPYIKEGTNYIIQIALKKDISLEQLAGYEWVISDKYLLKVLPEGYEESKAGPGHTQESPEVKISETVFKVTMEESAGKPEMAIGKTKRHIFNVKAIIRSVTLALTVFFPLKLFADTGDKAGFPVSFISSHPIIFLGGVAVLGFVLYFVIFRKPILVKKYSYKLLEEKDEEDRHRALEHLEKLRGKKAMKAIEKALLDESWWVRFSAGYVLKKMDITKTQTLENWRKMLQDPQAHKRASAARVLGELKDRGSVSSLIRMLINDNENVHVRTFVVEALGEIGDKEAIQPLIKVGSENSKEEYLVKYVAEALCKIGGVEIVSFLIELLGNPFIRGDKHLENKISSTLMSNVPLVRDILLLQKMMGTEGLRAAAINTLKKADFTAGEKLQIWREALDISDFNIQRSIIADLKKNAGAESATLLLEIADDAAKDLDVREVAIYSLGEVMQREKLSDDLLREINRVRDEVRGERVGYICEALEKTFAGESMDWRCLPRNRRLSAEDAAREADWELRFRAAMVLEDMVDPRAIGTLLNVMSRDEEGEVRKRARSALEKIRDAEFDKGAHSVDFWCKTLHDPNPAIQVFAAQTVGKIAWKKAIDEARAKEAEETLIMLLQSKDSHVCAVAANTLAALGGEKAVQPLIDLLIRSEKDLAFSAGSARFALSRMNVTVSQIIQSICKEIGKIEARYPSDAGLGVGQALVSVIYSISEGAQEGKRTNEVIKALAEMLKDEDMRLHLIAVIALSKVKDKRATQFLIDLFKGEPGIVRSMAFRMLLDVLRWGDGSAEAVREANCEEVIELIKSEGSAHLIVSEEEEKRLTDFIFKGDMAEAQELLAIGQQDIVSQEISPAEKPIKPSEKSDLKGTTKTPKETDSVIPPIIMLARRAKREGQKLIIGLDISWIPAYNKGTLQYNALNPLIGDIASLGDTLRDMGVDNVTVIVNSKQTGLAASLLEEAKNTSTDLSNIVVLTSEKAINSAEFAPLRSTPAEKKAFLAGIDSGELIRFSQKYQEDYNNQLYVQIMEMLMVTLELASGKNAPNLPIIKNYDGNQRIVIFLPEVQSMEYKKLQEFYDSKRRALQSV